MAKLAFTASLFLACALALPQAGGNGGENDNDSSSAVSFQPYYPDEAIYDALAGTYSLINTTSARNGEPIPDEAYGANPVGIITYSKSGWMSATITATEPELRPNLTFPFVPEQDDADWTLVGKHSVGYAGPLIVANVPTWVGSQQRRNYTVYHTSEGKLVLC